MTLSLPQLVAAAQGGELGAFTELVRRFQDMAVAFAYARLRDHALAEDVAQEAFVAAYRALPQLRQPGAFPAWLKRIVSKHVDRVQRVQTPDLASWDLVESGDIDRSAPYGADPFERLDRLERSRRVLAEVLALPGALRTSVILFYAGGHTLDEIADFVEEPVGTIKSRLHDARKKLRERLTDMDDCFDVVRPSRSPEFVRHVAELLSLVATGDDRAIAELIASEPDSVNAIGPHPIWGGEPHPLQVAAELGKTEVASALLDEGANPDARPATYDWSPLQLAIQNGHRQTAALLLERGATLDLWSSAALGNAARVLELVRRDPACVRARGPRGGTALHFAASVELMRLLLDAGADPLALDFNGNPPHQVLVAHAERREAARYSLAVSGAAPNIFFLCADGDRAGVERALEASPALLEMHSSRYDGAAPLSQGASPLHVAALHGQLLVARLLLDRGAAVDSRTADGQTALHLAAGAGHVALAELLLERGADVSALDAQHRATPLEWALFHHQRLSGPESCLLVAELLRARTK